MNNAFKYYAFISYNAKDTSWGKKLQKKLEHYKLPSTLCSEHGWERNPIKPVFFAPTDIQPGGLSNELQERLKASQLIVEGTPHSGNPETECFNPVIDKLGLPEILGANIHEKIYRQPWLNEERAYVQLVSKLLGVEFDAIWQRHKRQFIRKVLAWCLGSVAVIAALAAVWRANQPFETEVHFNEASAHNAQLPPLHNAIVTLTLDNESKTDTIRALDGRCTFTNIPHRFLNQPAHITVTCSDWLDTDTVVALSQELTLDLNRDPSVYGNILFRLWNINDEETVPHAKVDIEGFEALSDEDGMISLSIPLERQRKAYKIKSDLVLVNDTLFMPCGESDVVLVK